MNTSPNRNNIGLYEFYYNLVLSQSKISFIMIWITVRGGHHWDSLQQRCFPPRCASARGGVGPVRKWRSAKSVTRLKRTSGCFMLLDEGEKNIRRLEKDTRFRIGDETSRCIETRALQRCWLGLVSSLGHLPRVPPPTASPLNCPSFRMQAR